MERSRRIDGAATLTIVESRMFRIMAANTTANPAQIRGRACTAGTSGTAGTPRVSGRSRTAVISAPWSGGSVTRNARSLLGRIRSSLMAILEAMSETSGRLLSLLSLLQTPREWSGPELARRLHVTTRTVRNDVERLRQLGYPV